jgi:hypothetical protein
LPFEYFNNPTKTAEANSRDRTMSTVGDIGHIDEIHVSPTFMIDGLVQRADRPPPSYRRK